MDMEVDGKMRGPVHPVWATYRHLIKNAKVFLNGAISLIEAEELLKDGTGDLIIFGRPWLVNPDFANAAIAGKEKELQFNYNFDVSTWISLLCDAVGANTPIVLCPVPSWGSGEGLYRLSFHH